MGPTLTPRPVAGSLDELLAGATSRRPLRHDDGKSQVPMEQVVIDGQRLVVKHLHVDHDWIARGYGDLRGQPLQVWRSGLLDALPAEIDPAVVGAATGLGRNGWGAALLMRDVTSWLVPEGDEPVSLDQHAGFVEHMAALHAHFWGFHDPIGLTPAAHRWMIFGPAMLTVEERRGEAAVPAIATRGWEQFAVTAPTDVVDTVDALRHDLAPFLAAVERTPQTFVHGDWKMGNLGTHPDGRTILLDWQSPGRGPGASDLAWYLALNRARLPESKEVAIERYHQALVARGITTAGWWDEQLALCLLGGLIQFGWEKALGSADELGWWVEWARVGAARL